MWVENLFLFEIKKHVSAAIKNHHHKHANAPVALLCACVPGKHHEVDRAWHTVHDIMPASDKRDFVVAESTVFRILAVLVLFACGLRVLYILVSPLLSVSDAGINETCPAKSLDKSASANIEADWELARELEDAQQHLRVWTQASRGQLSFKMEAMVNSSVVELVAFSRETDLMPTWVWMCKSAAVTRVVSPLDIYAYADFGFFPLPMPAMFVGVHATLDDRVAKDGHVFVRVVSPSANTETEPSFDYEALPKATRKHGEMPIRGVDVKLVPQRPATAVDDAHAPPRTSVDCTVRFDLSSATFLGPARHLHPPGWLVNLLTSVMVPSAWKAYLQLQASIRSMADEAAAVSKDGARRDSTAKSKGGGGSAAALGERVAADVTGVYRRLQRSTGQRGGLVPFR